MKRKRTSKKRFDCVEMKREAQRRIYEQIKDMTPEEEIAYFHKQATTGPLAKWWQKVVEAGRESKATGRVSKQK